MRLKDKDTHQRNVAIILSGGTGTRLGSDIPKQYIEVNGKPIIGYVLDTIHECNRIDETVVVASEDWRDFITSVWNKEDKELKGQSKKQALRFASPGDTRQLSIYNALLEIDRLSEKEMSSNIQTSNDMLFGMKSEDSFDTNIVIFDAARPLVKKETIINILDELSDKNIDGVIPVLPMKDTVYLCQKYDDTEGHREQDHRGESRSIAGLLPRENVVAGQAPEGFKYRKYLQANESLMPDEILKINGSTEPAIMAGMNVKTIPGDEGNFKITTKNDLVRFADYLESISAR